MPALRPADLRSRYSRVALSRRLRRNLALKIVAVLSAVGMWIYVNNTLNATVKIFTIPITYVGLPPGFVITNPHPSFVRVQVTAGLRIMPIVTLPPCVIDLRGTGIGKDSIKLTPERFHLKERSATITGISPSEVVLNIDKMVVNETPVHLNISGKVAPGYEIIASEVAPPTVTLRGPSRDLDQLKSVQTEPMDVTGLTRDISRELALVAPGGMIRMTPPEVTATVHLGEVLTEREYRRLPIVVRGSDYRTQVFPPRVNLIVRGPTNELKKLDLGGAAYVDAQDLGPGVYDVPLRVKLPDGFELVRQSAQKIRLVVYRQTARR
jgi:YbbR domain-containing protein